MEAIENFAAPEPLPAVRSGQTDLSKTEARVLGCLIEKQRTTPDQYPLTLNALRLACNQSTNRDPVVEYSDAEIREALHRLERRGFVRLASGRGSRAPKYRHLLADALPMGEDEQALMCVLMLRGAQTPGELKGRTERMHSFAGLAAVAQALERLIARGLVRRLERRPGQKEERFCELLTAGSEESARTPGADEHAPVGDDRGIGAEPSGAASTRPQGNGLSADEHADAESSRGVSAEEFEQLRSRVERLERELEALRGEGVSEAAGAASSPQEPTAWEVN